MPYLKQASKIMDNDSNAFLSLASLLLNWCKIFCVLNCLCLLIYVCLRLLSTVRTLLLCHHCIPTKTFFAIYESHFLFYPDLIEGSAIRWWIISLAQIKSNMVIRMAEISIQRFISVMCESCKMVWKKCKNFEGRVLFS